MNERIWADFKDQVWLKGSSDCFSGCHQDVSLHCCTHTPVCLQEVEGKPVRLWTTKCCSSVAMLVIALAMLMYGIRFVFTGA